MISAVLVALAMAAPAQVFSPGPLSSAHKSLDNGLTSCVRCHEEGGKHSDAKCLECHSEIRARVDQNAGVHSARGRGGEQCAACHKEHKGGDGASLLEWRGGKHGFNHSLTAGWPLEGAHQKPDCKRCHEVRRIVDDAVRKLAVGSGGRTGRETYLGLSTACARCHFDEHRGQGGASCNTCHTPLAEWKAAPSFTHAKPQADFVLRGRHRSVACEKCHDDVEDQSTPKDAFPPPRARTFLQLQLKGVTQTSCTACHDDVHHGEFGRNCVKCHSEDGWKSIKASAEDTGFHDKTDFPLRGEHTSVTCKACHGTGSRASFKKLAHAHCNDCHADAHAGQLALDAGVVPCERCHTVNGFLPVQFDVAKHASTRFPLEGSHRAVACNLCHKSDARLLKHTKLAAAPGRELVASAVKLALPEVKSSDACEACHADPHKGQLAARACSACHTAAAFADVVFNHDDARFPLTGKHKNAACGACHFVPADAKGNMKGVVVYRPVGAACASCHADQHVGQLADADGATACERCHGTSGFAPARFDHDKQSSFPLQGKHKDARCDACHVVVAAGGVKAAKYKPLPSRCAGCHDDQHKGAFDAFAPAASTSTSASTLASSCAACHRPASWSPARFVHERTAFPLVGKHSGVACGGCHGGDTARPIPTSCAGCHQDPHAQEFGLMCRSCHTEDGFNAPTFTVDAHRRTNFPLTGRHAAIPCEECHVEKRERTFTRAALACVECHGKDAARASATTVSHARSPFSGDCRACHQPVSFTPASFPQHEGCFPIARGVHAPVSCRECHGDLRGASSTGTCAGVAVRCADCHVHNAAAEARHHRNVSGYEHKSEKCAGCHRSG